MDPSTAVQVVTLGQVFWGVVIAVGTVLAGIGGALWKVWGAVRSMMREETGRVSQEVASVKADLAALKAEMPGTIRTVVDAAIAHHEVSETKAWSDALGPMRERLAVLEAGRSKPRSRR